jgi:hypothetical protein
MAALGTKVIPIVHTVAYTFKSYDNDYARGIHETTYTCDEDIDGWAYSTQ